MTAGEPPAGTTVLVIDDQVLVRKMAAQLLSRAGVQTVLEAADGDEGLTVCRTERPSLILCDLNMRPVGGSEFVRRVRAEPGTHWRNVPVFLVSSARPETLDAEVMACGATGAVEKPLTLEKIQSVLVVLEP